MPVGDRGLGLMAPLPEGYRVLWIRPGIERSLIKVRLAIERHVEGRDGAVPLDEALGALQ